MRALGCAPIAGAHERLAVGVLLRAPKTATIEARAARVSRRIARLVIALERDGELAVAARIVAGIAAVEELRRDRGREPSPRSNGEARAS